jgi:hypothetical protein
LPEIKPFKIFHLRTILFEKNITKMVFSEELKTAQTGTATVRVLCTHPSSKNTTTPDSVIQRNTPLLLHIYRRAAELPERCCGEAEAINP